ncbi:PD40 domain-containing protein [Pseudanabaena sp. FACHB-2040]|uniref:PD40 domain-containing protein n=1 Tax=Pseudanabaena sp. FACHB-2040 TaxID=2692859 RepID=UPI001686EB4C|nr:PD40 domain-containing protein [Pseudanabaena sp. FACHB-2040]MBD2259255.1 PD40 domain-containing protein [Pseudanabaena sp. FACHB-2040]
MIELSLMVLLGQASYPLPASTLAHTDLAQAAPSAQNAPDPGSRSGVTSPRELTSNLSFAVISSLFSIAPTSANRQALLTLPNAGEEAPFDELSWAADGRLAAVYNLREVYVWTPNSPAPTQVFNSQCAYMPNLDLIWPSQGTTLLIRELCEAPASTSSRSMSLYVSDATSISGTRRLPGLPTNLSSRPYVSPDGSQVAYVEADHIYRLTIDAAQPQRITTQPGVYGAAGSPLAWSPDGRQLAFFEGNYPNQRLNVVDSDGSNRRLLTPEPDFQIYRSRIYWSPDGSRIAFYQPVDPPYDNREAVQLVTLATGEIRTVTIPGFYDALSWSPDGQKIALASGKVENQELFVLDVATGEFTPLTPEPLAQVMNTLWSPGGDWIAFSGEQAGQDLANQVLYAVRPDGTELRSLTSPDEYVYPFVWGP